MRELGWTDMDGHGRTRTERRGVYDPRWKGRARAEARSRANTLARTARAQRHRARVARWRLRQRHADSGASAYGAILERVLVGEVAGLPVSGGARRVIWHDRGLRGWVGWLWCCLLVRDWEVTQGTKGTRRTVMRKKGKAAARGFVGWILGRLFDRVPRVA